MKLLVSCLEASANLHLAQVLEYLPNHELNGIFDDKFGEPFMRSSEFSAMGFVEVLPLYFKAKRAIKEMINLARECDHVLLIDSPAFNLPLAKAIKEAGIKTPITYYILPQVWAWKAGRVAKVEKYCDNLASILPFDKMFYNRATYVGHPLMDELRVRKNTLMNSGKIAFLPGSRKAEITRLMPVFREVAKRIEGEKLLCVPEFLMKDIEIYGDISEFKVVNNTPRALLQSEFAFICSGTATLQSALIATPFVLAYKAKAIDMFIARRLVKVKFAGLANIIFDFLGKEPLHTELLQDEVSAENLLKAYRECDRQKFINGCVELREYLKHGSASAVAKMITNHKG
ncbi:lipid-A-disaccharide synthase [Campylobacter sp.]|uniref:lipid-A-disaccharide synthase n=1 Tax=Campylobacter sp. TaxID=205 RepID=UPI00270CA3C1|nr:lipid-A-disaccharide synthase [Campylobacter sp.]